MKIIKVTDELHEQLLIEKVKGKHKTVSDLIASKLSDEFATVSERSVHIPFAKPYTPSKNMERVVDELAGVSFIPDSQEQQ